MYILLYCTTLCKNTHCNNELAMMYIAPATCPDYWWCWYD